MRIAFYHYLPTGGAVRDAGQLLFRLRDRFEWEVHFPEGAAPLLPESGLTTRRYPFKAGRRISGPARLAAPFLLWRKAGAYLRLCRHVAEAIDGSGVASVFVCPSMIISSPPLLSMISVRSVYYCHEFPRYIYERNIFKTGSRLGDLLLLPLLAREKRLDREAARSATVLLANSAFMAPRLEQVYGREATVLRPGVDTGFFTPDENGPYKAGHLVSVGAFSPFKGHHLAIEAVSLLPEKSRPRLYVIADRGSYGYASELMEGAARLGVDLVMERSATDQRLRELYRGALAAVCAQMSEPYGLVPLEAGACGTPSVAVRQGGFIENVQDGLTGRLVDRTPQAIADALSDLVSDPFRASEMGRHAMEFVRAERTADAQARELELHLRGRT
jgi:glycosyltransferase involved in cell wall biosynthesis